MIRLLSAFIAVRMRRFWRFLLLLKSLLWRTIFSKSSISSWGSWALMKAFTAAETSSAEDDSGRAEETTWSIACLLWGLSSRNTYAHSSGAWRSTRYLKETARHRQVERQTTRIHPSMTGKKWRIELHTGGHKETAFKSRDTKRTTRNVFTLSLAYNSCSPSEFSVSTLSYIVSSPIKEILYVKPCAFLYAHSSFRLFPIYTDR